MAPWPNVVLIISNVRGCSYTQVFGIGKSDSWFTPRSLTFESVFANTSQVANAEWLMNIIRDRVGKSMSE